MSRMEHARLMHNLWVNKITIFIQDEKLIEIIKGSALAFGAKIIAAILGLGSSLIVARFYGPEIVGALALIGSFVSIVVVFSLMGTNTALLKIIPERLAKYSLKSARVAYTKTVGLVTMLSLTLGSICIFFSSAIATTLFSKPHLTFLFALASSAILFVSIHALNISALRALKAVELFALFQWLPSAIYLLLLSLATVFFYHVYNPIYLLMIVLPAISVLLSSYFIWKYFKCEAEATGIHGLSYGDIFSLSHPMFLTAVLFLTISQTDIIMLGMLSDEQSVGIYSIALKLAGLTAFVLNAINSILGPKFSELYHKGDMDELIYVAKKSSKMIFWATAPLAAALIIGGYWILEIFGEAFTLGYLALVVLAAAQFINAACGSVGYFLNMTGSQRQYRNIIFFSAIINVFGNYLLIPYFGISGAAFASMAGIIFANILPLLYIKRKFNFYIGYTPWSEDMLHGAAKHENKT